MLNWQRPIGGKGKRRWVISKMLVSKKIGLLLVLLLLSLTGLQSNAMEKESADPILPPALPFAPGEKLVYDVKYLGISTGTAVLAVLDAIFINGQEVYPLISTAQSGDFSSVFYPVNDRVESYLDVKGLYSHAIKVKQNEGGKKREKQIEFNQTEHKAIQIKNGKQEVFDIPPNVHDSLSSLYFFRTAPLTVGTSVFIDVHDGGKNYKLEIAVLGKETVATPIGTFDTIKVRATPRYEGLFFNKGSITLWVTDDDKKVPVQMKSKIKLGSITTTLISRREAPAVSGKSGPLFVGPLK